MRVKEVSILLLYAKFYSLDQSALRPERLVRNNHHLPLEASETHRDQPWDVSDSTHYIQVLNATEFYPKVRRS